MRECPLFGDVREQLWAVLLPVGMTSSARHQGSLSSLSQAEVKVETGTRATAWGRLCLQVQVGIPKVLMILKESQAASDWGCIA